MPEIAWIPFNRERDSIPGRIIEKAFINIPVTIERLPHKFNMQFDLGAVTTMLYGNTIKPFLEKYPSLENKLDTTLRFTVQGMGNPKFRDMSLKLGEIPFNGLNVGLFRDYGEEPPPGATELKEAIHIGTIAPDIFNGRVLIIDYPAARLAVTDSIPTEYMDAAFKNFRTDQGGRLYIPLNINGKDEDSGNLSWLDAWGITGNAYFIDNVVIIDYKNSCFGVK